MSRPAHESGAVIAVDQEVFVSDRVAVLLRYAIAYSTGLAFRVECIRGRPATDRATWLASPKTAELAPADDDTANGDPDQLRVSVSDERGPSNAEPDSAAADANSLIVEFWCDRGTRSRTHHRGVLGTARCGGNNEAHRGARPRRPAPDTLLLVSLALKGIRERWPNRSTYPQLPG
jgi:hypothetical protein